jgi:hypothetical protein
LRLLHTSKKRIQGGTTHRIQTLWAWWFGWLHFFQEINKEWQPDYHHEAIEDSHQVDVKAFLVHNTYCEHDLYLQVRFRIMDFSYPTLMGIQ